MRCTAFIAEVAACGEGVLQRQGGLRPIEAQQPHHLLGVRAVVRIVVRVVVRIGVVVVARVKVRVRVRVRVRFRARVRTRVRFRVRVSTRRDSAGRQVRVSGASTLGSACISLREQHLVRMRVKGER